MSAIYAPRNPAQGNELAAIGIGSLCILSVFALLPLLSALPEWLGGEEKTPVTVISEPTPPAPPEKPKPIEQSKDPIDKPDLKLKVPPMTIEMLGILINAGDNGTGITVDWGNSFTKADVTMEIYLESEVDERPRVLVAVQPLYPYSMRGDSGTVIVEFIIGADGKVRRPVVRKSTHYAFEQAAIDAIKKSKWQPGVVGDKPVDTLVRLPVHFNR